MTFHAQKTFLIPNEATMLKTVSSVVVQKVYETIKRRAKGYVNIGTSIIASILVVAVTKWSS